MKQNSLIKYFENTLLIEQTKVGQNYSVLFVRQIILFDFVLSEVVEKVSKKKIKIK